ncbi:MAG: UDP-2,3-diacylglucosamine diphosphatase [bacterium]
MPTYFFFSDAHLGAPNREDEALRQRRVLDFLDHAKTRGAGLFIVGDLFDFWFEYRHAIPNRNFAVLAKLHELRAAGLPIDYVAGNHDLWMGDFLRHEIGLALHENHVIRDLCGYHCYIIHGDGVAKNDGGYRLMKRIFKNPINIKLYRWVHPDVGIPLAKLVSHTSRAVKDNPNTWERDYRIYAEAKFAEGHDVVIMGHTHKPLFEVVGEKIFINLGDWMEHFTYCQFDENGPQLLTWPEQKLYFATTPPANREPNVSTKVLT